MIRLDGRWLHKLLLPVMALAFGHHEPVAYQPPGPAEVEALAEFLGLPDQRLPDDAATVEQAKSERPLLDANHIAVLPRPLQIRERVAAELQRVPQNPLSARHHPDVARDHSACHGQYLPRS